MQNVYPKPGFGKFISGLLQDAGLKESIREINTEKSRGVLLQAFVSKSENSGYNYELLELKGDAVVNLSAMDYISERFPEIKSTEWLATLKFNLTKTNGLSAIAEKLMYQNYILDNSVLQQPGTEPYRKLLEDVFESFVGALVQVVHTSFTDPGVGYAVAYTFLRKQFSHAKLTTVKEVESTAKSRLKETYDFIRLRPFPKFFETLTLENNRILVKVLFPENLQYAVETMDSVVGVNPGKRRQIAMNIPKYVLEEMEVHPSNIHVAEERVSLKALEKLAKMGIILPGKNPYEYDNALRVTRSLTQPPVKFRDAVFELLVTGGLNVSTAFELTSESNLLELYPAVISPGYGTIFHMGMHLQKGAAVIDLCIVDYVFKKIPRLNTVYAITHFRQKILANYYDDKDVLHNNFANTTTNLGLDSFLLYNAEESEQDPFDQIKLLKDSFKALIGLVYTLCNTKRGVGVGYYVCYNFIESELDRLKIPLDTSFEIPLWRLKNIYKDMGSLNQFMSFTYDQGKRVYKYVVSHPKTRNIIGTGDRPNKKDAETLATTRALRAIVSGKI